MDSLVFSIDDTLSHITEKELHPYLESLPNWRREQALRFKHLSGQRESAMAYHLLLRMLKQQHNITTPPHFIIGDNGKPTLAEYPNIHFNLSHCKEAVACAISSEPVGIDIECERKITPSLIQYTMNERETTEIEQSPNPTIHFLKLWTAKESVVKLTGQGISTDIKELLNKAVQQGITIKTFTNHEKRLAYSIATFASSTDSCSKTI